MNNEFSFESIFNMGVGNKSVATTNVVKSEERFDGNLDSMFADLTRSEEELNFLETFESMENYNSAQKLKMLAKINKEYGKCNRGIESYVRSMEADEVEGNTAKKDDGATETGKEGDKQKESPKTWKHMKWLQTVLRKIGSFFKMIWHAISNFFKKIANKIKSLFTKKKIKDAGKKAEAAKENPTTETSTAVSTTPETQAKIEKLNNTIIINSKLIDKFYAVAQKVEKSADEAAKALDSIDYSKDYITPKDQNGSTLNSKLKNDWAITAAAGLKLLTSVAKIVMKAAQNVTKLINNPDAIKSVANSNFNTFMTKYQQASEAMIKVYDGLKKGVGKDVRSQFVTDLSIAYKNSQNLAKEYIGYTNDVGPLTYNPQNPEDVKKIKDHIDSLAKGISEALADTNKVQNVTLKKIFGVETDGNWIAGEKRAEAKAVRNIAGNKAARTRQAKKDAYEKALDAASESYLINY